MAANEAAALAEAREQEAMLGGLLDVAGLSHLKGSRFFRIAREHGFLDRAESGDDRIRRLLNSCDALVAVRAHECRVEEPVRELKQGFKLSRYRLAAAIARLGAHAAASRWPELAREVSAFYRYAEPVAPYAVTRHGMPSWTFESRWDEPSAMLIECPREGWQARSDNLETIRMTSDGCVVSHIEYIAYSAFCLELSAGDADALACACHEQLTGESRRPQPNGADARLIALGSATAQWQGHGIQDLNSETAKVAAAQSETLDILQSLLRKTTAAVAALSEPSALWWESGAWAGHAHAVPLGIKAYGYAAKGAELSDLREREELLQLAIEWVESAPFDEPPDTSPELQSPDAPPPVTPQPDASPEVPPPDAGKQMPEVQPADAPPLDVPSAPPLRPPPPRDASAAAARAIDDINAHCIAALQSYRNGAPPISVRFEVTPAMQMELFERYPGLRTKYQQDVPSKMPAMEFWVRYFRSRAHWAIDNPDLARFQVVRCSSLLDPQRRKSTWMAAKSGCV